MKIVKKLSIDSAHKLSLPYDSKCNNLHGHRWEIEIEINAPINNNGMVIDFHKIKKFFEKFDHCYLNEVLPFHPTVENLAQYWCKEIKNMVGLFNVRIRVNETRDSYAEAVG